MTGTIGALVRRAAADHPERDAVVLPDRRVTFAELSAAVDRRAMSLIGCGIGPGDHVGILAHNSLEFIECFLAAAAIGAVAVPINPRFAPPELAWLIEHADLAAVLWASSGWPDPDDPIRLLDAALPELSRHGPLQISSAAAPRLRVVARIDGPPGPGVAGSDVFEAAGPYAGDPELARRRSSVQSSDPAAIIFTSGTTARPKGAVHRHDGLIRASIARLGERIERATEERHWAPGPLCHVAALGVLLGSIGLGDAFVTLPRVDAEVALRQLETERVTAAWVMFPAVVFSLLAHPSRPDVDLSGVRHAAVVLNPAAIAATEELFPKATVLSGYGMTEVVGIAALSGTSDSPEQRRSTCGRPFTGLEVIAADPATGRPLAAGEAGELRIRGYSLFAGYHRDPEATAAAIDPDGWYRTGDLGTVRPDGSVVFQGRLRDLLKVGGENVAPLEIESVLLEHPAVRAAAIIGAPDPRLDQIPVGVVELEPGSQVGAADLVAHCRRHLASFKVPRRIRFLMAGEWPMSETKIDKAALAAVLQEYGPDEDKGLNP